ncbi:MAG: nucleoside deaminase [Holophagaceae bacterium]|uniref:Nucleoside deaminase n=1 Tax=Candidatus Geothrix skivensis TaxID=2954439 RepID=A0A9D7SGJ1_9BACT|nr:nucleoside deaminase [Candidatus Geothrix skivensis]
MRRAIELSRIHMEAGEGGPFGAIVVKDGLIIGEGWNRVTSTCDPTAHGEVVAIREACARLGTFSLKGCEIYTSCEPCPMCLAAIYWARLDRIWYANNQADAAAIQFDDQWLYREVAMPIQERSLPTVQLLREEALAVFRAWEAKPDKVRY